MSSTGRNTMTLIGAQDDKETPATNYTRVNATSNELDVETEKGKSNALTGNRVSKGGYTKAYNCGGGMGLELTRETLPIILPIAGLEETIPPVNFETAVDGAGENTLSKITVISTYGISAGDSLDVGVGDAGMLVDTVDYRKKEIVFTTDLSSAPVGDEVVTNNDRYLHRFEMQDKLNKWATMYKIFTDANYYQRHLGCRIADLKFKVAKGSIVTSDLSILALEGEIKRGAVSDYSDFTSEDIDIMAFGSEIWLGGTAYEGLIDEVNISLNNNPDDNDRGLNDKFRGDIEAQGTEITFDFEAKFDADKYVDLKNDTMQNNYMPLDLILDEGVVVEMPRTSLKESKDPVSGPDKIKMSISGDGHSTDTGEPTLTVIVVDKNSTQY